jgi:serine/threonine protein kinase
MHCAFQENLLLNDKGHVKLTDMGLAKATETDRNRWFFPWFCHIFWHSGTPQVCPGKTYTTCGTPAPWHLMAMFSFSNLSFLPCLVKFQTLKFKR